MSMCIVRCQIELYLGVSTHKFISPGANEPATTIRSRQTPLFSIKMSMGTYNVAG